MIGAFVVLDFETSGKAPEQGGRMTEVAAVRVVDGQIAARYSSLANSGVRLYRPIVELTGITQQMVNAAPPADVVMQELLGFIGSDPVVAHNASFDRRVFDSECAHAALRADVDDFICSLRLSRRIYPHFESHALQTLAAELGIYYGGAAHRASTDADVTANLLIQLCQHLRSSLRGTAPDANLLRQIVDMPTKEARAMLAQVPEMQLT